MNQQLKVGDTVIADLDQGTAEWLLAAAAKYGKGNTECPVELSVERPASHDIDVRPGDRIANYVRQQELRAKITLTFLHEHHGRYDRLG